MLTNDYETKQLGNALTFFTRYNNGDNRRGSLVSLFYYTIQILETDKAKIQNDASEKIICILGQEKGCLFFFSFSTSDRFL